MMYSNFDGLFGAHPDQLLGLVAGAVRGFHPSRHFDWWRFPVEDVDVLLLLLPELLPLNGVGEDLDRGVDFGTGRNDGCGVIYGRRTLTIHLLFARDKSTLAIVIRRVVLSQTTPRPQARLILVLFEVFCDGNREGKSEDLFAVGGRFEGATL